MGVGVVVWDVGDAWRVADVFEYGVRIGRCAWRSCRRRRLELRVAESLPAPGSARQGGARAAADTERERKEAEARRTAAQVALEGGGRARWKRRMVQLERIHIGGGDIAGCIGGRGSRSELGVMSLGCRW